MRLMIILFGFVIGICIGIYKNKDKAYHGPNSKDIKKNIYKDNENEKYYKLVPMIHICPISISMNDKNNM